MKKITAKTIKQAKPKDKAYDIPDGDNLYLTVYPSGAKVWRFRLNVDGKRDWLRLGAADDMTIPQAREAAGGARKLVQAGINPKAEAQRMRHERRVMPTVSKFAEEYIRLHAKPNKKSWKQDRAMLDKWVLPHVGKLKLFELHRRDVVAIIDAVREAGYQRQPGKVFAVCRRMLKFAVERGVIETSPAVYVTVKQKKAVTHALTVDEIRQWWQGTFDPDMGSPAARLALRLLLLTGQRGSEVGGIRISELDIDAKTWHLPGERRKMGHPHRVPLSEPAVVVIQEALENCAEDDLLLPNRTRNGGVRVDGALYNTLERIFAGADRLPGTHDARRTVATELAELGVSEEAIAAVLGHQPKTVTAAYVKRREQMARGPLEAWARHLEGLLSQTDYGNGVQFSNHRMS